MIFGNVDLPCSLTLRRSQKGFTLLELLVAMTLMSMLSVMMYGGLQFGARVWERHSEASGRQSGVLNVQDVLRREISQAATVFYRSRQQTAVLFSGQQNELIFGGPVPEALGEGGRHVIRLRLERDGEQGRLALAWQPIVAQTRGLEFGENSETEVLLEGVSVLRISYFGRENDRSPSRWMNQWTNKTELPRLIKIGIAFPPEDPRVWPEFVAAVMTGRLRR